MHDPDQPLPIDIKLAGRLPKGSANGLAPTAREIAENPTVIHLVVGLLDVATDTVDHTKDVRIVTTRLRRLEIVDEDDRITVMRILMKARDSRDGQPQLPLEDAGDVQTAFELMIQELEDHANEAVSKDDDEQPETADDDLDTDLEGDDSGIDDPEDHFTSTGEDAPDSSTLRDDDEDAITEAEQALTDDEVTQARAKRAKLPDPFQVPTQRNTETTDDGEDDESIE